MSVLTQSLLHVFYSYIHDHTVQPGSVKQE